MHMIKRLLSLNHFACPLFPTLSVLLALSVAIMLSGKTVFANDCTEYISFDANSLTLKDVTDNQTGRTYTFTIYGTSGRQNCSSDEGLAAEYLHGASDATVINLNVSLSGIWNKSGRIATETVITNYGQLLRTFQCDYDPWLEPASNCTLTSHQVTPSTGPLNAPSAFRDNWWVYYEDINFRHRFPTSALALDHDIRSELISKAMTQTLRIIDPVEDQSFASPDLMVTAVMERPVINPPDYAVAIKVEEIAWPEPGVTPQNRKYEEGKNYLQTANQLITYFNLKGKDLWGAKWGVSAHVVSKEPGWTPVTYFTVDALVSGDLGSTLSEPPNNQLIPPQIHNPRANRTYTIEENIPLKITYDPDAELTIKYSSRATGAADFIHYVTWRYSPEYTSHPGQVELGNFLSLPALFAGSTDAQVKVEAFIEKEQAGVTLKSETAAVVTRVLVSKPEISKPEENKQYAAPTEVNLIIIKSHKGADSWKNWIEMEVQATGQGGLNSADLFLPYADDTYTVSEVFNTLLIKYRLTNPGKYRFRTRFVVPESYGAGAASTPWTDWRHIEVVGDISSSLRLISLYIN